ncbi:MAG: hypothetical protein M1833_002727 [Piccolia ochrophora]|nr:MAG: hypothetical protein M1833_002727 [Piccolia ochrophora]
MSKPGPNLRLPSFELLGIATPHPDRMRRSRQDWLTGWTEAQRTSEGERRRAPGSEKSQMIDETAHESVEIENKITSTVHQMSLRPHLTGILTPPEECPSISWASAHSVPRSDPSLPSSPSQATSTNVQQSKPSTAAAAASGNNHNAQPQSRPQDIRGSSSQQSPMDQSFLNQQDLEDPSLYLDRACSELVSQSLPLASPNHATQILCQTLPRPHLVKSTEANEMATVEDSPVAYTCPTALTVVINAIREKYGEHSRRPFLHISHAIQSSSVNLSQLPSSPPLTDTNFSFSGPSTPGYFDSVAAGLETPASPGYFSPMVFVNAVPIPQTTLSRASAPPDLQNFDAWQEIQRTAPLPSPNPIVPPFSQHVSILERYIPPSSPEEDQKIFSASILVDRLFELSPSGGSLLFIYPTKAGAETFAKDYLDPVLGPLLRGLMARNGIPREFCELIDNMTAIEFMLNFPGLQEKVRNICARATADMRNVGGPGHRETTDEVKLVFASQTTVRLDPEAWEQWWYYQESERIGRIVKNFFKKGAGLPKNLSQGQLERDILHGVHPLPVTDARGIKMARRTMSTPTPPLEVGVFVLRRST